MTNKAVTCADVDAMLQAAGRGDLYRADVEAMLNVFLERRVSDMVDRFLAWRLPDDFYPDAGISFARDLMQTQPPYAWPTGTNLLHAGQAEQMVRYMLGLSAAKDVAA